MAANVQIAVKDEQVAGQWLEMVRGINEEYYAAMQEAGNALTGLQDSADGTLVDEFVNFGNGLLDAAKNTFDAIDMIADTVNSIIDTVNTFKDGVISGIGNAVRKILG